MARAMFEPVFRDIFPFWSERSDSDRSIICNATVALTYPRGVTLHDGSECSGVIFIRSGTLRVYMMSESGKDVTLYRLHAGDLCILTASCVIPSMNFDVFVDAEEDSECYVVNGPTYAEIADRNPQIKIFTLESTIERFSDIMWVMQQILFMSMDKRLAIFLSDESARIGSSVIPLTHEQIAKYMGSAREVVSRMLKYFANEGIVEISRKGVKILDKSKLRMMTI